MNKSNREVKERDCICRTKWYVDGKLTNHERQCIEASEPKLYTEEELLKAVKEERIKFWNELRIMLYKKYGYKEFLVPVKIWKQSSIQ